MSLKQLKSFRVIKILGKIQTVYGFVTHLIKCQWASKTENSLKSTIVT